ncbi:MAG: hypothetical protein QOF11_2025 [Chloroflexota bacterium]|nr:hypothetical protein [Chloroflexota bacterium]
MASILALVIPLVAFVVLAAVFIVLFRRASRSLTRTRDEERFRRAVEDLAARIDTSLTGVIERIDAVRRHHVAADTIEPNLAAARDAVARYTQEAAALHGPVPADDVRANLLAELERAARALEMATYGCGVMTAPSGPHQELEAQTAIKRGYLNTLHAREAIARHADDLASGRPADQRRWLSRRKR